MNAGFDAASPQKPPDYYSEEKFLIEMNQAEPGIFNKLDGWASHSYPNPGFAGLPTDIGKGSIQTYKWELDLLKQLGVTKPLPVFITETGWKHSEGIVLDRNLPNADKVASYFKEAFSSVWNDPRIVAITPFILNYQEAPFDHFSFKKITGEKQILPKGVQVLGAQYPEFYTPYQTLSDLPKVKGSPQQDNLATLVKGGIYRTLIAGESYTITMTIKNTGQSIWGEQAPVKLVANKGGAELSINPVVLNGQVEPGQEYTYEVHLKAPSSGSFVTELNLYSGDKEFDSGAFQFASVVTSPVVLKIKTSLPWNRDPTGSYLLGTGGVTGTSIQNVAVDPSGLSNEITNKSLLPGYDFIFTIDRPYYQSKIIRGKVESGVNTIDFGELQPDFMSALLNPQELWKLLPFSK
jgi:hypothetical protein